jgi:hypothetical protein
MAKKQKAEEQKDNGILVKVLSMEEGLLEYENIEFIRITSKDYNLMIMKDYLPVIGEIKGKVEFQSKEGSVKLENITAYYMHKHNEFNLFVK